MSVSCNTSNVQPFARRNLWDAKHIGTTTVMFDSHNTWNAQYMEWSNLWDAKLSGTMTFTFGSPNTWNVQSIPATLGWETRWNYRFMCGSLNTWDIQHIARSNSWDAKHHRTTTFMIASCNTWNVQYMARSNLQGAKHNGTLTFLFGSRNAWIWDAKHNGTMTFTFGSPKLHGQTVSGMSECARRTSKLRTFQTGEGTMRVITSEGFKAQRCFFGCPGEFLKFLCGGWIIKNHPKPFGHTFFSEEVLSWAHGKKASVFPVWFYNMCCYKDRTLKKYLGFSLLALLQVRMSSKKQVFLLLGIQKKLDQAKNMFGPQTKTSPKSFVVLVLWFY